MRHFLTIGLVLAAVTILAATARAADGPATGAAAPAGPAPIYTKSNAPAAPKLEDLPLKASVERHGITWTFEKPARCGQFVNGDWYVVGPVTVVAMDPKPVYDGKDVRNGSMLNPPALGMSQAFDTRSIKPESFKKDLLAKLPVAMKPGDSLVSAISEAKARKDGEAIGYRGFEGLKGEKPDAAVCAELKKINEQITGHAAELLADPTKADALLK